MDKKWYKYVEINEVKEADRNAKDHDVGTLCESMIRFGYTQPILVDKKTKKLLAGHGRIKALKSLKQNKYDAPKNILVDEDKWLVPCHEVDMENDGEAEAYLIADNRLTELGGWNDDLLLESLHGILKETGSLDGTGWDLDDMDDILKTMEEPITQESEEVSIKVGKYKLKVSQDAYDQWALMVQSQVGKDKDEIILWIAQQLQIETL
jgi:ParB-like chromosome segregation protein Spo0J